MCENQEEELIKYRLSAAESSMLVALHVTVEITPELVQQQQEIMFEDFRPFIAYRLIKLEWHHWLITINQKILISYHFD